MKWFAVALTVLTTFAVASEAKAQNGLLGRLFRGRAVTTQIYTPIQQHNYVPTFRQEFSYSSRPARTPRPVTGYGSNLHRNYMIRRAQQRAATTGIQPRNTGNIFWSR